MAILAPNSLSLPKVGNGTAGGPTWPILTTSASAGGAAGAGAAAVGAGVAAGAAASSFLPQATSVSAASATAVHFNCMGNLQNLDENNKKPVV
jgi:hypothetical protein